MLPGPLAVVANCVVLEEGDSPSVTNNSVVLGKALCLSGLDLLL